MFTDYVSMEHMKNAIVCISSSCVLSCRKSRRVPKAKYSALDHKGDPRKGEKEELKYGTPRIWIIPFLLKKTGKSIKCP